MSLRTLPSTDHDILISMWTLLVGTNGEGLLGKFETFSNETREHLQTIDAALPTMWTRAEHAAAEREAAECNDRRQERRRLGIRDWIMLGLTAASVGTVLVQTLMTKGG